MVKEDLIERSPVRKFEKLLGGGVKAGEIGVIASKKGLGKTSILVQLAIDTLLQGKTVIHVSFNQQADYVATWYENIFTEHASRKNLNKVAEVKAELMARRIVLNFNQETVHTEQVIKTISALADSGIKADSIIIDGFDFDKATDTCIKDMRRLRPRRELRFGTARTSSLKAAPSPKNTRPLPKTRTLFSF